jgi:xanthine dehydrogenase small subunit
MPVAMANSTKSLEPSSVSTVRFVVGGQEHVAQGELTQRTVLEYLREDCGLTGTKEGCAEGDCGACTVLLGEVAVDGSLQHRAINSCIRLLPSIHGKQIVSIEHLSGKSGHLHPAQAAMEKAHATQCGFCTPGFVMSLAAQPQGKALCASDARQCLNGNLCRCTGYRAIVEAACSMHDASRFPPVAEQDRQWQAQEVADLLRAIPTANEAGELSAQWLAPNSAAEFARHYVADPERLIVAGMTDIGLWVTKQLRDLGKLLYLGDVKEFHSIEISSKDLVIHAAVSLSDAWAALCSAYPQWRTYADRFASTPVQNSGTLVGNLANGSPIGDAMPALIAVGASLLLQRGDSMRELPLEDFYLGYRKTALERGEFVRAVRVPILAAEKWRVQAYKLSKRFDQDISAVALGVALELDEAGVVRSARLGVGGMAATPMRARKTEAALLNKPYLSEEITGVGAMLSAEFSPLSDMRASAQYRAQALGNLLVRDSLLAQGRGVDLAQSREHV